MREIEPIEERGVRRSYARVVASASSSSSDSTSSSSPRVPRVALVDVPSQEESDQEMQIASTHEDSRSDQEADSPAQSSSSKKSKTKKQKKKGIPSSRKRKQISRSSSPPAVHVRRPGREADQDPSAESTIEMNQSQAQERKYDSSSDNPELEQLNEPAQPVHVAGVEYWDMYGRDAMAGPAPEDVRHQRAHQRNRQHLERSRSATSLSSPTVSDTDSSSRPSTPRDPLDDQENVPDLELPATAPVAASVNPSMPINPPVADQLPSQVSIPVTLLTQLLSQHSGAGNFLPSAVAPVARSDFDTDSRGPKPAVPSTFDGSDAALKKLPEWLRELETNLRYSFIHMDESLTDSNKKQHDKLIRYVATFFKGSAGVWWEHNHASLKVTCWKELKAALKKRFIPVQEQLRARLELKNLKQKSGESIFQYCQRVQHLCALAMDMSDSDQVANFVYGIHNDRLKDKVLEYRPPATTLLEVIDITAQLDAHWVFHQAAYKAGSSGNSNASSNSGASSSRYRRRGAGQTGRPRKPFFRNGNRSANSTGSTDAQTAEVHQLQYDENGNNSSSSSSNNQGGNGRDQSENLNAIQGRPSRTTLPEADRQILYQKGLCFNCKKPNHVASRCTSQTVSMEAAGLKNGKSFGNKQHPSWQSKNY